MSVAIERRGATIPVRSRGLRIGSLVASVVGFAYEAGHGARVLTTTAFGSALVF